MKAIKSIGSFIGIFLLFITPIESEKFWIPFVWIGVCALIMYLSGTFKSEPKRNPDLPVPRVQEKPCDELIAGRYYRTTEKMNKFSNIFQFVKEEGYGIYFKELRSTEPLLKSNDGLVGFCKYTRFWEMSDEDMEQLKMEK